LTYQQAESMALTASKSGWELLLIHHEGRGYAWKWANFTGPVDIHIHGSTDAESKEVALIMALEQIAIL